jgi:aspartate-semialdehyde dehydrogenase
VEECSKLLSDFEGVEVWNDSLPTPLDVEGKNEVLVSRLRQGLSSKNILNFWVVSDNLLKGAALNAVQIAKFLEKL